MLLHIKTVKDEETDENIIESFTCIPNSFHKGAGLLPVNEVVVDASTVPQSFYTEWFNYKVNRLGSPVLEWSGKQYTKNKK